MAHFAEIDQNNTVLRVTVVHDSLEAHGEQWCHNTLGGTWVQTSYNGRIRKNYAGVGYTYDPARDAFIPPNPGFPSWTLNEATCQWVPPVPMPTDGMYVWDESTLAWSQIGTP
jgi:hypothetical protein